MVNKKTENVKLSHAEIKKKSFLSEQAPTRGFVFLLE